MKTNKPHLAPTSATSRSKQPTSHNTPHLSRPIYTQLSGTRALPHPTQPLPPLLLLPPHLTPLHLSPRPALHQQSTSNPTQSAPLTIGCTPISFQQPQSISHPRPRNPPILSHPWAAHHSAYARKLRRGRASRAGTVSHRNVLPIHATDPQCRSRAPPPLHRPCNHSNSNHCVSRPHTLPHPRHQQFPRSHTPGQHPTQPNSTTIHSPHHSPNLPALFLATQPNQCHPHSIRYHQHNPRGRNESSPAKKNTAQKTTRGATMAAAGKINKRIVPLY